MKPGRSHAVSWLLMLALGCASTPPGDVPAGDTPEAGPTELELELVDVGQQLLGDMIVEKARLENFQYRLNRTARRFCGELVRPLVGVLVGGPAPDDEDWKQEASLRRGLGDQLTVLHLVPGGPFERAGFERGDAIVSVGSETLTTRSELFRWLIDSPGVERVEVVRRRGSVEVAVDVELDMGCPIPFELASGSGLLPRQSGAFGVGAQRGLVLYAQDDDVLAAALAHALAHLLFDDGAVDDLAAEQRADQLGILLAGAAGYDVDATVGYWEEMARAYPWIVAPKRARGSRRNSFRSIGARALYDHHDLARRMPGIRARVAEVKERIARATADAGGAAP